MAGSHNNYWGQQGMNSPCCDLGTDMEHNPTELQQQQAAKEFETNFPQSQSPFYSDTYRLSHHNMPRPHEGDQVVPSFQRLTVLEGHHREAKPLPPLPDPEELMSDEAADSEVEFFTSDRRRLLPKTCPRPACYGATAAGRGSGQVNYAYRGSPSRSGSGRTGSMAYSWPGTADSGTGSGANVGPSFGVNSWTLGGDKCGAQGQQDNEQLVTAVRSTSCSKQPDQLMSSRLQYFCSGPGYHPLQSSSTPCPAVKPEIPPRIPIPPKPPILPKTVMDEWSVGSSEEDKPPKIPPRVPLIPICPPRTPSPKSLPLYINGVMPATQSFAPNPKYVSKALQRQQSERAPPADQSSPCIVPVMKDGRQASGTHYFLLPCRPAYMDRLERFFREPERKDDTSMCNTDLGCQNT